MIARVLPVVLALLVGWHLPRHRRALLLAVICLGFAVVFTLLYVYPINAVLFAQAGGSHSAEEVRAMVNRWILADRLRFAVGIAGFLSILWAFRLPVSER